MARKKDGIIGFDPLAWMKEPGPESGAASPAPVTPRPAAVERVTAPAAPTPETTESPDVVVLGDRLTIEQAAAMHAELGRHLGATSIVLEAGALQRIDAAGLQLLTAFMGAAEGRGARVEWRAPSAALHDAACRLGLATALHLT